MLSPLNAPRSTRRYVFGSLVAAVLLLAWLTSSCIPKIVPLPPTTSPSLTPATPTPLAIDAPVIDTPNLVNIRMMDEANGWGIGDNWILRTADGGNTWHDVSPHAATTFGYTVTFDFLDVLHAWILVPNPNDMLSGILYRTGDGGATWNESPVPFGGGALQFLDARQGWMMASLGAGAGSMGVAVFQTADAGASWTQSYTNDPNAPGSAETLPLSGLKDGIAPLSMQQAWIGGVVYSPGTLYLYQTQDGGHSWKKSSAAAPPGYEQAELETTGPVLVSSKVSYLPVHISSQNGVVLAIYASHDSGASWAPSPTFIPQGGSVDFVADQAGIAWNGTNFYVTDDGAQTWNTITPDVDFGDNFAGMDFVSLQVGFVVTDDGSGSRHLYKTVDGAATWNLLGK